MKQSMQKYWHPRKRIANNLLYRIASSSAISRFKMSQTATLKELYKNPDIEFSDDAKEILILKYDVWSQFVYTLEQFLLVERGASADAIIEFCNSIVSEIEEYYNDTLMNDDKVGLNIRYIQLWTKIHHNLKELLFEDIKTDIKNIVLEASTDMVNAHVFDHIITHLADILHYTLYEVFALDLLFYHDNSPLRFIYDKVAYDYVLKTGHSLIAQMIEMMYVNEPELMKNKYNVYIKVFSPEVYYICKKELEEVSKKYSLNIVYD